MDANNNDTTNDINNDVNNDDISYNPIHSTQDGRVVLLGDAAHAMTPSTGEGCNTALESAVKLADCIQQQKQNDDNDVDSCGYITREALSKAFHQYGASRPKETYPIQKASAMASRYKKS